MPLSRQLRIALVLGLLGVLPVTPAKAATLTVDAKSNIFGAGHASPPGTEPGVLPPSFTFAAGAGQKLTFSSVSGLIRPCCPPPIAGPEGEAGSTDITSVGGISGIVDSTRTLPLVGVFLTGSGPVDPAPARLDFSPTALGHDFTSLSPQIGQTFYIGNGKTGAGTQQEFVAPATATRLYLGFADANVFNGAPGHYDDNVGSLAASFTVGATATPTVWDLAADFKTASDQSNTANDVWSYMQSTSLDPNPANHTLLPTYGSFCRGEGWQSGSFYPWVAKHLGTDSACPEWGDNTGMAVGHPAPGNPAIVAWKSPLTGTVGVSGGIDDWDAGGGDGVRWSIHLGSQLLASGAIGNDGTQNFSGGSGGTGLSSVSVQAGQVLYFLVDPRGQGAADPPTGGDAGFDTTGLSITITEGGGGSGGGGGAPAGTYAAEWVSQSGPNSPLAPFEKSTLQFTFKNTGTETLVRDGANPTNCRATNPRDRYSDWIDPSGADVIGSGGVQGVRIDQPSVAPGELFTCTIPLRAPGFHNRSDNEYFSPVVEGKQWLLANDYVWYPLKTTPLTIDTSFPAECDKGNLASYDPAACRKAQKKQMNAELKQEIGAIMSVFTACSTSKNREDYRQYFGYRAVLCGANGQLLGTISKSGEFSPLSKGLTTERVGGGNVINVGAGHVINVGAGHVINVGAGHVKNTSSGNVINVGAGNVIATGSGTFDVVRDANKRVVGVINVGSGNLVGAQVINVGSGNVINVGAGHIIATGSGNVINVGAGHVINVGAGHVINVGAGHIADPGSIKSLFAQPTAFGAGAFNQTIAVQGLAGRAAVAARSSAKRRRPAALTVASGKVKFAAPGQKQLELRFRAAARRKLSRLAKLNRTRIRRHRRPVAITLTLTKRFRDATGKSVGATRSVRIRPGVRARR